jgi:DNA-binding NarL/FixJ family response regulator
VAIITPPARVGGAIIRVAILDQHPAVRAGLDAILRLTPGIEPVGAAADRRELWALLGASEPHVVLIDDLRLCPALRVRSPEARVVLHASEELVVPAAFAGVSAVVAKTAEPAELIAAIEGQRALSPIPPRLQRRAAERLEGPDRPILAMRLAGTPDRDIAEVVGVSPAVLAARCAAILARLV